MQTNHAAALFSMAVVNDRITRFVRDNDLPIVILVLVIAQAAHKPAL